MVWDNALVRSAALCSADCVRANVQGDIGVGTVVLDAHLFVSTDPHKLRTFTAIACWKQAPDMTCCHCHCPKWPSSSRIYWGVQWHAPRPRAAQGSGGRWTKSGGTSQVYWAWVKTWDSRYFIFLVLPCAIGHFVWNVSFDLSILVLPTMSFQLR